MNNIKMKMEEVSVWEEEGARLFQILQVQVVKMKHHVLFKTLMRIFKSQLLVQDVMCVVQASFMEEWYRMCDMSEGSLFWLCSSGMIGGRGQPDVLWRLQEHNKYWDIKCDIIYLEKKQQNILDYTL